MTESSGSKSKQKLLGTKLQRVMTRPPILINADVTLADAATRMLDASIGSLLVVDDAGQLIGIVTDGDFAARRAGIPFSTIRRPQVLGEWLGEEGIERIYEEARRRTVAEIMSTPVHSVTEDDSIEQVLRMMLERDIKHMPVVSDGRPVGMIARHDLLKMMLHNLAESEPAQAEEES